MTSHDVMTSYPSLGRPIAQAAARAFCETLPDDIQNYLRVKVWLVFRDSMDFSAVAEMPDECFCYDASVIHVTKKESLVCCSLVILLFRYQIRS